MAIAITYLSPCDQQLPRSVGAVAARAYSASAADPCRYCVMIPELLILAEISPATLFITCNRIELSLIDGSLIEIGSGWLVPVPCLMPEVTEDVRVYCLSR